MSSSNGVIRIGRKGIKKFAFGEDGEPFDVDVVVAFQEWVTIDDQFRQRDDVEMIEERQSVRLEDMPAYHNAAVEFVKRLSGCQVITSAEALDFIARLREQYDELADFFVPRSRRGRASPVISETASLEFSEDPTEN